MGLKWRWRVRETSIQKNGDRVVLISRALWGSYPSTVLRLETLALPLGKSNEATWEQGERWPQGGAGDPELRGRGGAYSGDPASPFLKTGQQQSIGNQQGLWEGVLAVQGSPP